MKSYLKVMAMTEFTNPAVMTSLVLLAALCLGCQTRPDAPQRSRAHEVADGSGKSNPSHPDDTFDWQHNGPLAFLDHLKKMGGGAYTVDGYHKEWVEEKDIPQLIELLNSTEPCAYVLSVFSSAIPFDVKHSTVDREAAFLIHGFREGSYPPSLHSQEPYFKFDKEEIKAWWAKHEQVRIIAPRAGAAGVEFECRACGKRFQACSSCGSPARGHDMVNHPPKHQGCGGRGIIVPAIINGTGPGQVGPGAARESAGVGEGTDQGTGDRDR